MTRVRFDCTLEEQRLVNQIVARAVARVPDLDPMDLAMDLLATNANGRPIDFARLLIADDADFRHDIFGIREHLDRRTGKLERFFLPRYAKPAVAS